MGLFDDLIKKSLVVLNKIETREENGKKFISQKQLQKIDKNDIITDYYSLDKKYYNVIDKDTGELKETSVYNYDEKDIYKIYYGRILTNHVYHNMIREYLNNLTFEEFNDKYGLDYLSFLKETTLSNLISVFNITDINDEKNIKRIDPFYNTIIFNDCENILDIYVKRDSKVYKYKGLDVNHIYVEFKYKGVLLCKYDVPCVVNDTDLSNKLISKDTKIGDYLSNFRSHILGTGNVCLNEDRDVQTSFNTIGSIDIWVGELLLLRLLGV